ncbi:MAG: porin family protein [Bacteroidota bacterium]|nr:porin family protein [Bacteroidota bacterium]
MIMKCKLYCFLPVLLFCATGLQAQLGIKAGLNIANEINSFSSSDIKAGFKSTNLTGYQIGLVYQAMPKKSGFGAEIGAIISQKGSTFSDSVNFAGVIKQGYKELNYIEVPLNLRYRLSLGILGLYGFAGIYGGYALNGKTVNETTNEIQNETYAGFMNHVDYGYNFGAGVELFRKIQLGTTLSQGIKNTSTAITGVPTPSTATNKVYTVNLVYLF